MSESWDFDAAAKIRLRPAQETESPAYEDGCLLRLLAATRARGVPFVAPSARLLFTEQDLVLQASLQCSLWVVQNMCTALRQLMDE